MYYFKKNLKRTRNNSQCIIYDHNIVLTINESGYLRITLRGSNLQYCRDSKNAIFRLGITFNLVLENH